MVRHTRPHCQKGRHVAVYLSTASPCSSTVFHCSSTAIHCSYTAFPGEQAVIRQEGRHTISMNPFCMGHSCGWDSPHGAAAVGRGDKRAGTSLCTCLYIRNIAQKPGPFSVARPRMDLPRHHRLVYSRVHRKGAGPLVGPLHHRLAYKPRS